MDADADVVDRICAMLREGAAARDAAEAAGMDADSFRQRMHDDSAFARAVRRAEAQCAVALARRIYEAASAKEWRAAEAWLKRRRPDWGDERADGGQPTGLMLFDKVVFDDETDAGDG